jgi:hypothetical protein
MVWPELPTSSHANAPAPALQATGAQPPPSLSAGEAADAAYGGGLRHSRQWCQGGTRGGGSPE